MKRILMPSAIAAAMLAMPAAAEIVIHDAYARASNTMAGAAFMEIENTGEADDRLIDVRSDAAQRVELHTHQTRGDGIARMIHVEDGFVIPAGRTHPLARGGDHVMFMGLTAPMEQGDTVTVTLVFEDAGEIVVEMPVDLQRNPAFGGAGN